MLWFDWQRSTRIRPATQTTKFPATFSALLPRCTSIFSSGSLGTLTEGGLEIAMFDFWTRFQQQKCFFPKFCVLILLGKHAWLLKKAKKRTLTSSQLEKRLVSTWLSHVSRTHPKEMMHPSVPTLVSGRLALGQMSYEWPYNSLHGLVNKGSARRW